MPYLYVKIYLDTKIYEIRKGYKMKKIKLISFMLISVLLLMGCSSKSANDIGNLEKYIKLGEYKELKYTPTALPVNDNEINAEIENMLISHKEDKSITDRPIKDGDVVNIDYKGLLNGTAFEGGTAQGYDLKIGSNSFIPGFESQLIGVKSGEKVDLNLTFPKEYQSAELAGKEVVFEVTVNDIKEEVLPELTDEFVKEKFGFDDIDSYKKSVKANLQEQADFPDKLALLEMAATNSEIIEYPKEKLDKNIADMKVQLEQNAASSSMKPEDFLQNYLHMTMEEFDKESKVQAEKALATELTVLAIAEAEDLNISDAEFDKILDTYTQQFNLKSSEELIDMYGEEAVRKQAIYEKVMDFLVENSVKN